jgi:hypothetical protein
MLWIMDWSKYCSLPSSFEMSTIFTCHLAGGRVAVVSSYRRCVGTNRIWSARIRMRVDMFLWPLVEAELHGVSSQTRMTDTAKNGALLLSDEASVFMTDFSMSPCSYSDLAMPEVVHQNRKEFMTAPKNASSGKVER